MQSASDMISSLLWFTRAEEGADGGEGATGAGGETGGTDSQQVEEVDQFVYTVQDFSSQYGSEVSVSYTAFNLRGPPSNFPDYGDYPQSFVMRTYGKWWDEAPSAGEDYMPQNNPDIPSQDFAEISFEHAVCPESVNVFETYNPGALVRVWAQGSTDWLLLWEGPPGYASARPRIFSPPIRPIKEFIRVLRLEFNHRELRYYTEIDAVLLKGLREPTNRASIKRHLSSPVFHTRHACAPPGDLEILSRVLASNLHESVTSPHTIQIGTKEDAPGQLQGDFHLLPDETILYILKFLDLKSLCRCATVNRHFNRLASDSILYRSLNLKPYWHCLRSPVLMTLARRCKFLQRLDLSWCGSHGFLNSESIIKFLKECQTGLTHLRMNSCKFVDTELLRAVVETCPGLEELALRGAYRCDYTCLASLTHLRRLDMYRSDISTVQTVGIISANPRLQHLNLGSCANISSMDLVAMALGNNCPDLISVDFWKSYSLSPHGLRALGGCRKLREIDVSWCLSAGGSGEWVAWVAGRELRKLFLGALRGISDRDLHALVRCSPHLQQLDLLGGKTCTKDICSLILAECHELQLLDVSFCDQIPESQVAIWRAQYPHVSIMRSFQSADFQYSTEHTPPNFLQRFAEVDDNHPVFQQ